jgi:predicted RNA-binding protein with PIN domain
MPALPGTADFAGGRQILPVSRRGMAFKRLSTFDWPGIGYAWDVALVRILVDGYSLLHQWKSLAPGQPRHSAAAREELVHILTRYQDYCGIAITIVFDGSGPARGSEETASTKEVEVLFSRDGQTADQIIERAAFRLQDYGEALAVTDDYAERDTVMNMGGLATSCGEFIRTVESAMADLERDVKNYNQREQARFRQG